MSNSNFSFDFDFLRVGFWLTVFMVLIKYTCDVNISLFMAFIPLIISFGILFLIIFTIGLITIVLMARELREKEDEENKDEEDKDDEED